MPIGMLERYKIKDPGDQKADADKLKERFCGVPHLFFGFALRKNTKTHGYEQGKCNKIEKVDHFFLPRQISTASIIAR